METARFRRAIGLALALAMAVVALLTVRHYIAVRYPATLADAAACRAGTFFSCADSAMAPVAAPFGVPLGVFGFVVAAFLALDALFPSPRFDRTARAVAWLNGGLGLALVGYSVVGLRSLCLLCTAYTVFALLYVAFGVPPVRRPILTTRRSPLPAPMHLSVLGVALLMGGGAGRLYLQARDAARAGGEATAVVRQFFALDTVPPPAELSPYRVLSATPRFEDAPVRIVEYGDFLCSDCRYLAEQIRRLDAEFPGRINLAYQFFPLEAKCNDVVEKDKHPGACELSYMAAYRPDRFLAVYDSVLAHPAEAKDSAWRAELARRLGLEGAAGDSATRAIVARLIATGADYAPTSSEYAHGIRSTPTLIINGRMVIGTLPYEQLRAIVAALVGRSASGGRYIEHWVDD